MTPHLLSERTRYRLRSGRCLAGRHHLLLAVTRPLAATGGVVTARARRLADPPPRARWVCHGLALAALTLAIAAVSALVPVFAFTGV